MSRSKAFMEIGEFKFYCEDTLKVNVKKSNKSALFQLRDKYAPILLHSDMDEASTYKVMLLMERNKDTVMEWYSRWAR